MKKVLIIRGSAIGDVIECLPVASALKSSFNEKFEIHWLIRRNFKKIMEGNRFIDKVLCFEDYKDLPLRFAKRIYGKKKNINGIDIYAKFSKANKLKNVHYDIVINLHNEFYARMFSKMCGASKNVNAPWIDAVDTVYDSNKHRIIENLETLKLIDDTFDIDNFVKQGIDYGWNFSEVESKEVEAILKENGCRSDGYVVVVLSTTWQSKNYPIQNWVEVIKLLQRHNKQIVFIGDAKDYELLKIIKSQVGNNLIVDLVGKTSLRQMMVVLTKASVVCGGDTGPLHIAASLNVDTVTLMNPTYPEKYAPFADKGIVLTAEYPCKNCHLTKCPKGICCMKHIAPSRVYTAITSLINKHEYY